MAYATSPPETPWHGVSIAPASTTLSESPAWVRLDDGITRVASYTIDRGRQYEMDMTDGGRAEIVIWDLDGTMDPTNPTGAYYGQLEPLIQVGISRWNPVTDEWQSRFRGFVDEYSYDYHPSQRAMALSISCVDIYEICEQCQMQPVAYGDEPPLQVAVSDIFYDNANVDDRIIQLFGNAGIPASFFKIFTGNVQLYESTYSAGTTILSAIQECVDAEFPSVANFYPDRFGRGVFHGRLAKFYPQQVFDEVVEDPLLFPPRWEWTSWSVGDGTYVDAAPTTRAQMREFAFTRGVDKVLNSALATPLWIDDKDIEAQLVTDPTSIGLRGIRDWSRQSLLTKHGYLGGTDALTETKRFASYIVGNYKTPHNRITKMVFRPLRDDDPRSAYLWDLLCRADISQTVNVNIDAPGGGGFSNATFFIEGIHESVVGKVGGSSGKILDDVTLSLDVSPDTLYSYDPFVS